MRTFLLIAPYFAPQAAVGGYRWVKLARHLVHLGYTPVVLCATFPNDAKDPDLATAVPAEIVVEDNYLDPRILATTTWIDKVSKRISPPKPAKADRPLAGLSPFQSLGDRYAVHGLHAAGRAIELGRRENVSAVVVSAGPFSAVRVAFHVANALKVPIVLDFRDPFALHESGASERQSLGDRARGVIIKRAERRWMERADHVVLNTRNALAAYREAYPFLADKSSFIRNHFDFSLYDPVPEEEKPPARFTILHTGTLRAETKLDDIAAALRLLIERDRLTPADLVLRQIGRFTDYERNLVKKLGLEGFIEFIPPMPQRALLGELRRGHLLLSMVDPRVMLRIAAKTYDYIASGMPIVSITKNPEVDELLAHREDNARLEPGDVNALVSTLSTHIERFRATRALPEPVPPPAEFSSETAAARMSALLDRLITK